MFFPDEYGNPQIIDLVEYPSNASTKLAMVHDNADSKVTFWLYNK